MTFSCYIGYLNISIPTKNRSERRAYRTSKLASTIGEALPDTRRTPLLKLNGSLLDRTSFAAPAPTSDIIPTSTNVIAALRLLTESLLTYLQHAPPVGRPLEVGAHNEAVKIWLILSTRARHAEPDAPQHASLLTMSVLDIHHLGPGPRPIA